MNLKNNIYKMCIATGKSEQAIKMKLNGKTEFTLSEVVKIMEEFKVSFDEFRGMLVDYEDYIRKNKRG